VEVIGMVTDMMVGKVGRETGEGKAFIFWLFFD